MIEILLYGVIGDPYDQLDAKTIRLLITGSEGDIVVRINSGGGYVMEGLAIFNALAEAKAAGRKVTVYIDGLAASMASVIAMVGEEIRMADNALFMIHNPWDVAMGDATQLRQAADRLDQVRDQLVGIYHGRTGLTTSVLTAMMNAETWMNAAQALENKFITEIVETSTAQASAIKPVNISKFGFAHAPANPLIVNQPTPADPANPVSPTAQASVPKEKTTMDPELIKKILAFVRANNVVAAISEKALTGEITYEEMVTQHGAVVAASATNSTTAVAAERARVRQVNAYIAANPNVDATLAANAIAGDVSFEDLVNQHVTAVNAGQQRAPTNGLRVGETLDLSPAAEMEARAEALTETAFNSLRRMNPRANRAAPQLSERAQAFRGEGLRSAAAALCRLNGVSISDGMTDSAVIAAAMRVQPRAQSGGNISTGDLGGVLGQPVRAVLDDGYQAQIVETNFESWTSEVQVRDFKANQMLHVGMFTGIRGVSEGGKLPMAKLGEGARFITLDTRGLMVSWTRKARINDEFGIFMMGINSLGKVYRQDEQDICVAALLAGKMTTDKGEENIFGAQYSNDIQVAAFDKDAVSAARQAMRKQRTDPKLGGFRLSSTPRLMLVSPDLETQAEILTTPGLIAANVVGEAVAGSTTRLEYQVIDELPEGTAYLTGASGLSDVIRVSRLAEAPGPVIEQVAQTSFNATEFESYNDFTANGVGRFGIVRIRVQ